MALLLAVVTVKTFQFFSNANLIKNPSTADADLGNKVLTSYPAGRTLFLNYCASCHSINRKLTGPALAGITERVPDRNLLIAWIKNNQKVLQTKNPYFIRLAKEYDNLQMTVFPQLDDKDINMILNYITEEQKKEIRAIP